MSGWLTTLIETTSWLVRTRPAASAPTALTAAAVKAHSPSVQSRTFRIIVCMALCSISGVSVRSIVQACRDQVLRRQSMVSNALAEGCVECGAEEGGHGIAYAGIGRIVVGIARERREG